MQAQCDTLPQECFVPLHTDSLHNLASPVGQISTLIDLFLRRQRQRAGPDEQEALNFLRTSTARLLKLITALQEYMLVVDSPRVFRSCDGNLLIAVAIASLDSLIRESGANVIHEHLPQVNCNPSQISYVFTSLIENAIKFRSEARPEVRIAATSAGGDWLFSVQDNGIGIDARHRESVFHMFRRINGEDYDGAGAGLAIARRVIEQHGGRIWVVSEPGHGSTFFFTLPAE
jgi:light-regulated signal transduction histidine kinase (bacteriophytochrome)